MLLRPTTLLGMVISIVTGIAVGIAGFGHWRSQQQPDSVQLETLKEVLQHVRASYVDEVDTQDLLQDAMRGMLKGLDAHSTYLNANDYTDLQTQTTGSFSGIGIELGLVDDYFTVISPIDNTPAARAGLQSGDRIMAINEAPLKGKVLDEVIDILRGKIGTEVNMQLQRAEGDDLRQFNINIARANIAIDSVRSEWLEPGYGYIRIAQFQTETGRDFHNALEKLNRQAARQKGEVRGLVLDLRNNPGGLLQASVSVADALLRKGLIVYTEGRLISSQIKYRAAGKDYLNDAPIVVLINGGSASAAEIVAGALQDQGRALLLGERSYGKGSVQSVVPLSDTQAIKLTTAYYFTPSGRSIHKSGIEPDVEFAATDEEDFELNLRAKALSMLQSDTLQARLQTD